MKTVAEAQDAIAKLDNLYNCAKHDPKLHNYCLAIANRRQAISWMLNDQSMAVIAPEDNPYFADIFAADVY